MFPVRRIGADSQANLSRDISEKSSSIASLSMETNLLREQVRTFVVDLISRRWDSERAHFMPTLRFSLFAFFLGRGGSL